MSASGPSRYDNISASNNATQIFGNRDVTVHIGQKFDNEALGNLPYAPGAAFNSARLEDERSCLPDTRTELLEIIHKWICSPDSRQIFWLSGMAGTGKSTIARTVARHYSDSGNLVGSFFFSRGGGDLADGSKLITTLARQLASWSRVTGHNILVLVIDALDECDDWNSIPSIVRAMAQGRRTHSVQLRVLLTSRPEVIIQDSFQELLDTLHQDFALHNIESHVVQRDLEVFFRHEFHKIRVSRRLSTTFPGDANILTLVERAASLFIYAATVCLYVGERRLPHPQRRLEMILESDVVGTTAVQTLDQMYMQVLLQAVSNYLEHERRDFYLYFQLIVGCVVVAFNPLSATALAGLCHLHLGDVSLTTENLSTVLNVPKDETLPVSFLHPSFRDFLLDRTRCGDSNFRIHSAKKHCEFAQQCLDLMDRCLKRDICGSGKLGMLANELDRATISTHLPSELAYACRYWVQHLESASPDIGIAEVAEVVKRVEAFFQKRLLHWLEAMSLLGEVRSCISMLANLLSVPQILQHQLLTELVRDAHRFVMNCCATIEEAPLQTYVSALVFSPSQCLTRSVYQSEEPVWMRSKPVTTKSWGSLLQTLVMREPVPVSATVSPDGLTIVCYNHHRIEVCDAATGAIKQNIICGSICSLTISSDGASIVVVLDEQKLHKRLMVQTWDIATGNLRSTVQAPLASIFCSLSFSGAEVLFKLRDKPMSNRDGPMFIMNSATGAMRDLLLPSDRALGVGLLVFSFDGTMLSFRGYSYRLCLLNITTGRCISELSGHHDYVTSVAFSPDDTIIATGTGSKDQTLRIWEVYTGVCKAILAVHEDIGDITSLVSSSDCSMIVSASEDHKLRIWDTKTSTMKHTFEVHTGSIESIAFSSDAARLISGSREGTVWIWDLGVKTCEQSSQEHSDAPYRLIIASDQTKIISGSSSGIRLWDTMAEEGHHVKATSSQFRHLVLSSPNGCKIVDWERLRTPCLSLLDLDSGNSLQLPGLLLNARMGGIEFSSSGERLMAGFGSGDICLWDVNNGALILQIKAHAGRIGSVAFSSSEEKIASAADDGTIRIWSTGFGSLLLEIPDDNDQTLTRFSDREVLALAFSPSEDRLVGGCRSGAVYVWETVSGATIHLFDHGSSVLDVAYTPSGRTVLSSAHEETKIWDAASGELQQTLKTRWTSFRSITAGWDQHLPILDSDNRWVTVDGKRILLLPSDQRVSDITGIIAVNGSMMAFGFESGMVTVLGIDFEKLLSS